ncbi:MAG: 50S ribosomal protein L24 [Chloroflexi bacterium]|nr:50S ribosomal protein L24 [Chloroflexota bacterium]
MNRIRKGDTVRVLSGEFRGEEGTVRTFLPKEGRVVISGINLVKRHQRPTGRVRTQAGIIEFEAPVYLDKVVLICPNCKKTTRPHVGQNETGKKVRTCPECGQNIDK